MLYERWRKISAEQRDQLALNDFATGKHWTFAEMFIAGEKSGVAEVSIPNVLQSNGVVHVITSVVQPN